MTRRVGTVSFVGLALIGALSSGCVRHTQETRIAELPGYYGKRPRPVRRPPKIVKRWTPPARPSAPGRDWLPRGGISDRWECMVIHHSASDRSTPQGMRDYHVRERGWQALGYHFVIGNGVGYADGKVYVGERWKRQMHGAHCKTPGNYYNNHGIGICLIGNLDNHSPTPKQIESLARLTSYLSQNAGISKSKVYTHGGVTKKTACPGRHFSLSNVLRKMSTRAVSASSR